MGNHMSNKSCDGCGRVILSDGTVHKYDKPLTAAELMLEYPQQVVVEFQTVLNGKRPTPLPADTNLEANKLYMMVPKRGGGKPPPTMSSEETRRVLMSANAALSSKMTFLSSYTGFLPLFARICPGINGEMVMKASTVVRKNKTAKLEEKAKEMWRRGFFEEEKLGENYNYLSRQFSGKSSWKPSLDTITEKCANAKIRHWLV